MLYLFTPVFIIIVACFILWLFEKFNYEQEIKDEESSSEEDN
jgi:hypothetical protein